MIISCSLRLIQGLLATVATIFLIVKAKDVKEVVLNFAAMGFISGLDVVAFKLALNGSYGRLLKDEAKRIKNKRIPSYIANKPNQSLLKKLSFAFILVGMLSGVSFVIFKQTNMILSPCIS